VFARELSLARRVLTEERRLHGRKIYSLHVPEARRGRLPPKVQARVAPEAAPAAAAAEMPAKAVAEPAQEGLAARVGETPQEEWHSVEVLAFLAAAAATGPNKGRKARRNTPKPETAEPG
jgi:hypothetical protein